MVQTLFGKSQSRSALHGSSLSSGPSSLPPPGAYLRVYPRVYPVALQVPQRQESGVTSLFFWLFLFFSFYFFN